MKSYNNLMAAAKSEGTRNNAVHKVLLSRKGASALSNCSEEEIVKSSMEWIENYKTIKHTPITIYDGISRKQRKIVIPTFKELTVQHCVVIACMPMFYKGMYEHSYASIPGRGAHKAKKVIEKWIQKDPKNCKYVLKMDIRHFFRYNPA